MAGCFSWLNIEGGSMSNLVKLNNRGELWLQSHNLPWTDNVELKKSSCAFKNKALYGVEIPVVNSLSTLQNIIKVLEENDLKCDRFNETRGSFLLSESEIKDMLSLCKEKNIGITFSLSSRPEYDTKASFYKSKFGMEQCRRVNNNNAISHAVEETLRLSDMGCRGIIVYDIGILTILSQMREEGLLPADLVFKASSHCMASNPMITKILYDNGADHVTMIHDVSMPVLQETRRICPDVVMDVPIDTYADKGGFIRLNDLAEIVQIASPVILKIGASAQKNPYDFVGGEVVRQRVKMLKVAIESLKRTLGEDRGEHISIPNKNKCIPEC